ncbi:MAG: hypothetical protein ACFFCQ_06860 [Promethearchaeota archaeon]
MTYETPSLEILRDIYCHLKRNDNYNICYRTDREIWQLSIEKGVIKEHKRIEQGKESIGAIATDTHGNLFFSDGTLLKQVGKDEPIAETDELITTIALGAEGEIFYNEGVVLRQVGKQDPIGTADATILAIATNEKMVVFGGDDFQLREAYSNNIIGGAEGPINVIVPEISGTFIYGSNDKCLRRTGSKSPIAKAGGAILSVVVSESGRIYYTGLDGVISKVVKYQLIGEPVYTTEGWIYAMTVTPDEKIIFGRSEPQKSLGILNKQSGMVDISVNVQDSILSIILL